ncbi:ribbon-helix-helix domain-containing protein [Candidatus Micrarchaeota archaeon]|jgi:metal-responsive CopG/Arc/MetJ family transcriptional regulator|nr:ribbon-helix-helix domain-containing protein [Candidatus Micrarchaeota archaeon]
MSETKKHTTISIPTPLFKKVEQRIKGTGFTSVSSYVIYILREIIAEKNKDEKEEMPEAFNEEDEEKIKNRLKALGYMD